MCKGARKFRIMKNTRDCMSYGGRKFGRVQPHAGIVVLFKDVWHHYEHHQNN